MGKDFSLGNNDPGTETPFLLIVWKFNYFGNREFFDMTYLDAADMDAAEVAAFEYMISKYGDKDDEVLDTGNSIGVAIIFEIADNRHLDIDGHKARIAEKNRIIQSRLALDARRRVYETLKREFEEV